MSHLRAIRGEIGRRAWWRSAVSRHLNPSLIGGLSLIVVKCALFARRFSGLTTLSDQTMVDSGRIEVYGLHIQVPATWTWRKRDPAALFAPHRRPKGRRCPFSLHPASFATPCEPPATVGNPPHRTCVPKRPQRTGTYARSLRIRSSRRAPLRRERSTSTRAAPTASSGPPTSPSANVPMRWVISSREELSEPSSADRLMAPVLAAAGAPVDTDDSPPRAVR